MEWQTSSGLWVSGDKANRMTEAIPRSLPAGNVPSKFRDYSSFLRAAVTIPWVNACSSLLAYTFAANPFDIVSEERVIDDPAHPLLQLLAAPNPQQTGFAFRELLMMHWTLTGNAYATLESRDGHGRPRELYLANPSRMRVVPGPDGVAGYAFDVSGMGGVGWAPTSGKQLIPYGPDEVIHLRLPHPDDDFYGLGNVEACQAILDIVAAMSTHELAYWQGGGRILGVLQTAETLSAEEFGRLRTEWALANSDRRQRVRTAILEKGLTYRPIAEGLASLDISAINAAKRDDILAVWGVPKPKLGIVEDAQYKLDDADRTFHSETMQPYYRRFEEGIQPLIDLFDPALSWRFERQNFEDDTTKLKNAALMFSSGLFSLDEARQYTGADPLPRDTGAVLLASTAFSPVPIAGYTAYAQESITPPAPPAPTPVTAAPPAAADANGVSLADHVPGMKALDQERHDEERRAALVHAVKRSALRRPAVSPMERLRSHKRLSQGAPVRPQRASLAHPATGVALQRDRARVLDANLPGLASALRAAFRVQQKAVTRPAVLSRILRDPEWPKALRSAWPATVLADTLRPVCRQAGQAGYQAGRRMIPHKAASLAPAVEESFDYLGEDISRRWQSIDDNTFNAISEQLAEGIRRGYSALQVANGFPDEGFEGIAGVFAHAADARAETIARTEIMHAYLGGSIAAFSDAGVERVELMDGDYDEICADRDGRIVPLDDVPHEHPNGTLAVVPAPQPFGPTGELIDGEEG